MDGGLWRACTAYMSGVVLHEIGRLVFGREQASRLTTQAYESMVMTISMITQLPNYI